MTALSRSRRSFLRTVGTVGASLPFARLLWSSVADAAETQPLRFVAFFTPHGFVPEYWTPQGTEDAFSLQFENSMLSPLEPWKDKILVLDGLDYRVLYEYGNTGHEGAPVSFLTGSRLTKNTGTELPSNASLDQVLAEQIGASTRFRSLQLQGFQEFDGQHVYNSISFGKDGNRIPFERNPASVYKRLFGDFAGGESPEALAALERKKSLLDYLIKDVSAMRARLAGPEQQKLDAHLAALRDVERRLGGAGLTCSRPVAPLSYGLDKLGQLDRAPELVKLHLDLIAQAFACDLTRIVTMPILIGPSMPFLGINESVHDNIAHMIDVASGTEKLTIRTRLAQVHRWYAEQVAYLMNALASIPEGNGTVLDNTVILWGNELGNPAAHSNVGVPTILAGGAGGKFRMGRYLKLRTGGDPLAGWDGGGTKAPNLVAHNKLLVSIAKAFGVGGDSFGHPDYKGALTRLT